MSRESAAGLVWFFADFTLEILDVLSIPISPMFRRLQNGHTDTSANKGGGNNKNRVFRKGPIAAVTNPLGGYKVVI